ncbi:MAG: diacylglycerol kinase family protein [Chloroflexi bacterium]|nr:diacylglycerol kinase family protein [Chloroflexota bacterium]
MRRQSRGRLVDSFAYAFEGLRYCFLAERNVRIHLAIAVAVLALSLWLRISVLEWALIIVAIALVFAGEMLNTVVEMTVDLITLEDRPLAKCAKDVAAGAILVAAIAAAIIGFLVLGPHLWHKLFGSSPIGNLFPASPLYS